MPTLLERAKKVSIRDSKKVIVSDELLECAIAWITGEITMKQIAVVTGKGRNIYYLLPVLLREAYRREIIITKPNGQPRLRKHQ